MFLGHYLGSDLYLCNSDCKDSMLLLARYSDRPGGYIIAQPDKVPSDPRLKLAYNIAREKVIN